MKINYLKLVLKNKLSKKNLYLGYHKHSKDDFNVYIHPFADEDKESIIFYYDYKKNDILLQKFFGYLEQYYSLVNKEEKNTRYNTKLVIDFLKDQYNIRSNYLDRYLNNGLTSSKNRYQVFHTFFKTLRPKQVFIYCYYDSYANNALLAANVLNIKTIEYQHSSISDSHFAYAKWNNPSTLSEHFPKTFFLWDVESKEVVSKNFSDDNTSPIITITGNKYLLGQIKTKENLKLKSDPRNILICLQGIWIPEFLESFILEDKFYKWYIRLHPRYPQDKVKLDNLLMQKTSGVFYEEANNIDLYKLFEKVSIVMTSFSGVALEAESFNKKVIIFGKDGFNTYRNKIEEKTYNFVENSASLHSILNRND